MPSSLCAYLDEVRHNILTQLDEEPYEFTYVVRLENQSYEVKEQLLINTEDPDMPELRVSTVIDAVIVSSLKHPNILPIVELCVQGGYLQIISPITIPLQEWLKQEHQEEEEEKLATQIDCVTQFLHRNQLYHNNLGLQNIVLRDNQSYLTNFESLSMGYAKDSDYHWNFLHRRPSLKPSNCDTGDGKIQRAEIRRSVGAYSKLAKRLHDLISCNTECYHHGQRLMRASSLPESPLLFLASYYLATIIRSRNADIYSFCVAGDFTATEICNKAIDLAENLRWRLL